VAAALRLHDKIETSETTKKMDKQAATSSKAIKKDTKQSPKQQRKVSFTSSQEGSSPKKFKARINIMKNYSRALTNFALSELAVPYLAGIMEQNQLDISTFQSFIREKKKRVNCIRNLRELLLIYETDSAQLASCKRAFEAICEVFLKYFCVNWIYHSKINDKLQHLKYRFKILRRVKDPAHFTYLEPCQTST